MTHSGGFYELQKRKSLKKGEAVGTLYWFKWESYTTWITGVLLLAVVYWMGAGTFLVDRSVADLGESAAIAISLGLLPFGYLLYEGLWATPPARSQRAFAAVGLLLVLALGYALTHLLSARAAFLQVGATLGTIMTANVFFRIIPAQRHMLAATAAETPVDTSYGVRAKGRSIQNHYLTFPVLFTMLSNHFPSTYGHPLAWVVLGLMFVVGVGLKHVMSFRYRTHPLVLAGTAVALIAVIGMTARSANALAGLEAYQGRPHVSFATVSAIVQARCVTCHSAHPTSPVFPAPPEGVRLDTTEQIVALSERIWVRAVATKTMPLANSTGMTDAERALLGAWIAQGKDPMAAGPAQVVIVPGAGGATPGVDLGPGLGAGAAARSRYGYVCQMCHGEKGDGRTPTTAAFPVKPRDFTDPKWQASITDDAIRKIVVGGGAAVGKSSVMPPNPDLAARPQVLDELVKIVRAFGGAPK